MQIDKISSNPDDNSDKCNHNFQQINAQVAGKKGFTPKPFVLYCLAIRNDGLPRNWLDHE
jgi:hypothetical protein